MVHKHRNPSMTPMSWQAQPSVPGDFQPGPSLWNNSGRPHMVHGNLELAPNPWHHSAHGASSVPITQVHLRSHIQILHSDQRQGQGVPFHEILAPESQHHQRPLHFNDHAPLEADVKR
jgi:hypothetical protein